MLYPKNKDTPYCPENTLDRINCSMLILTETSKRMPCCNCTKLKVQSAQNKYFFGSVNYYYLSLRHHQELNYECQPSRTLRW